jgi:hypothetical protein
VKAVDQKAREIPKLYLDKAQDIDRKYCGTHPNNIGPLQQCLESFGSILVIKSQEAGRSFRGQEIIKASGRLDDQSIGF